MLVRLKYAEKPLRLIALAEGTKRRADLRWMMAVIVDDRRPVALSDQRHAAVDAAKFADCIGRLLRVDAARMASRHRHRRVEEVVRARQRQSDHGRRLVLVENLPRMATSIDCRHARAPGRFTVDGTPFDRRRQVAKRLTDARILPVGDQQAVGRHELGKLAERLHDLTDPAVTVEVIFLHIQQ